jgi:hypothetical protein
MAEFESGEGVPQSATTLTGGAMNLSFGSSGKPKRVSHEHRRAVRRTSPELAAYHWTDSHPKQDSVRDISSTGVFLETDERWAPGDLIALTLQRRGPLEGNIERRVAVQAKAVRNDDHGVGMSFVLPAGMDLHLWDNPLMATGEQNDPEDILREFRIAGALAFAQRICPSSAADTRKLLREGLSNYRVVSATEIALSAERILALRPDAERMQVPSSVLLRILEDGSWAESEPTQQLWAGLLATSCTLEGNDESNLELVNMLSQLTTIHIRFFSTACIKSSKYMSSEDRVSARSITLTAAEMTQITGSRDLIRIHRDLEHLSDLGLLTITVRSMSFSPIEGTDVAPTSKALDLFARCNGHRGSTQEFYGVPANASRNLAAESRVLVSNDVTLAGE